MKPELNRVRACRAWVETGRTGQEVMAITSCPVRPVSTHALQALTLFNSGFMQEVSHSFAARLENSCAANHTCQIDQAWQFALGRRPRPQETRLAREFFQSGGT